MPIKARLTERLGIEHPIGSAAARMIHNVWRAGGIVQCIVQEAEKLLAIKALGYVPVGTSQNLR